MNKVILISSVPPPMGGIAKWTQRMLATTLPNGWEIALVNDRIVGKRECFGDSIKYNYIDEIRRWLRVWKELFIKTKNKDVRLAHACPIATVPSMLVNIVSALIVKLVGRKHIIHFRCTVPNLISNGFQLFLLRALCRLSDTIICLNNQTKEFLNLYTKTPLYLIPNFVDVEEINARNTKEVLSHVVYVGGVTSEKGCDNIIQVAKQCPDIIFSLIGNASSEIKSMANNVENVKFLGVKSGTELSSCLRNADVFMFLSRFWGEGFSNAVAEAMAAGLPCVVTNWAANADQIEHGRGGFVVGKDIVNDSIEALTKLKDPIVRKQFSDFNITKVKKEYSADIIVDKYIKCYESLI